MVEDTFRGLSVREDDADRLIALLRMISAERTTGAPEQAADLMMLAHRIKQGIRYGGQHTHERESD